MNLSTPKRRYRINPIEVAIFGLVAGIVLHSVYDLVSQSRDFRATALGNMAAANINPDRAPASAVVHTSKFESFNMGCDPQVTHETNAPKIRLAGPLCNKPEDEMGLKAVVTNTSNRFSATVFPNIGRKTYSTNYIPLEPGLNPIKIEFTAANGSRFSQELAVKKN